MTAPPILSRLEALPRFRQVRPDAFVARCPVHEDDSPSLSWTIGEDGRVLILCRAGCATEAIVHTLGTKLADLFVPLGDRPAVPPIPRRIVATYDYTDEAGTLLYQSVRYEPKDFRQRAADGSWSLNGTRRVLYRLPALVTDPKAPVAFVEGEKDVDRLAREGFLATTSPMGAGNWRPEYAEELRGRTVYLIPDNDEPGRAHAADVARSLAGEDVRTVDLPGLRPKGDVSDWLDTGHTGDELRALLESAAPTEAHVDDHLRGMNAADLLALDIPPMRQAIAGLVPEGLGVIGAPPKAGKSLLAYQLAVELVCAGDLFGIEAERRPVRYYALEDGRRRSQGRIRALLKGRGAGLADLDLQWTAPNLGGGLEAEIGAWLDGHPLGVVIVDVLSKVRASGKAGLNAYDEDYAAITGLHGAARRHPGSTVLLVTHDRKAGSDDWMTRITGTRGVTGAADFVIFIARRRTEMVGTIYVTGRDIEDRAYDVEFTGSGWRLAGIEQVIGTKSPTRQTIFNWVKEHGPAWQRDIAEGTDLAIGTVHARVHDMAADGELVGGPTGYVVPNDV